MIIIDQDAELSVSAWYQNGTPSRPERIVLMLNNTRINLDPDTAVRIYGALGAELRERDSHEAAMECRKVGRG